MLRFENGQSQKIMYTQRDHQSLRTRNSFGIEVSARHYVEFESAEDLRAFFADRPDTDEPYYILSGGNNVLFTEDYPGTILHPVSRGLTLLERTADRVVVRVAGGEEWDDFVGWAVSHGYGGVENLSLIPGYVGAAPVQNIGAYGAEAAQTIREVEVYLPKQNEVKRLDRQACRFAYRDSLFKRELKGQAIILSVTFELSLHPTFNLGYGDLKARVEAFGEVTLSRVREAVMAIRREKLPDPAILGNAGSFFKNPVVPVSVAETLRQTYPDMPVYGVDETRVKLAAGWLIDRCGWKGRRMGPVGVHDRQALVLVNHGGATGRQVMELARTIQQDVRQRFGVEIETEVNVL